MKYFRVFETESNYTDFVNGSDYVTPNLCVIRSTGGTKCKPYIPPPPTPAVAGDVAYWDGSKVKTTPLSSWSTSLGTPIGVVVVPEGFAPDGKTRIISLMGVDRNGNQSSSHVGMGWGSTGTDTSLTNYTKVPTTDNAGSTSTGSNVFGYLPSDKFTGTTSYVDSKVKYYDYYDCYIPSPYVGDEPNPEYYKTISDNNALSDFNGLSNTQTLVGLSTGYTAANAAYKYKDGASNLQWYLPAMGELGYIMPRFNVINNTITTLGGLAIDGNGNNGFWSSSESDDFNTHNISTDDGYVFADTKFLLYYMRPFAILDDGEDNGGGDSIPNNQIHYTSIDNKIVYPYYKNGFGSNIVSNTNENGLGVITFDGDITTFEAQVYAEDKELTSITIPNSVTLIQFSAFEYCTQLTSVTIGEGVTEIEYCAFYRCSSLSSVYCKAKTPPSLGSSVFRDSASGRKIYVPIESVDAYRVAEGWSGYAKDIVGYNF